MIERKNLGAYYGIFQAGSIQVQVAKVFSGAEVVEPASAIQDDTLKTSTFVLTNRGKVKDSRMKYAGDARDFYCVDRRHHFCPRRLRKSEPVASESNKLTLVQQQQLSHLIPPTSTRTTSTEADPFLLVVCAKIESITFTTTMMQTEALAPELGFLNWKRS